ncbi:MAG: hypothetical protein ACTSO2_13195 [Promethearchaeota archaeon]
MVEKRSRSTSKKKTTKSGIEPLDHYIDKHKKDLEKKKNEIERKLKGQQLLQKQLLQKKKLKLSKSEEIYIDLINRIPEVSLREFMLLVTSNVTELKFIQEKTLIKSKVLIKQSNSNANDISYIFAYPSYNIKKEENLLFYILTLSLNQTNRKLEAKLKQINYKLDFEEATFTKFDEIAEKSISIGISMSSYSRINSLQAYFGFPPAYFIIRRFSNFSIDYFSDSLSTLKQISTVLNMDLHQINDTSSFCFFEPTCRNKLEKAIFPPIKEKNISSYDLLNAINVNDISELTAPSNAKELIDDISRNYLIAPAIVANSIDTIFNQLQSYVPQDKLGTLNTLENFYSILKDKINQENIQDKDTEEITPNQADFYILRLCHPFFLNLYETIYHEFIKVPYTMHNEFLSFLFEIRSMFFGLISNRFTFTNETLTSLLNRFGTRYKNLYFSRVKPGSNFTFTNSNPSISDDMLNIEPDYNLDVEQYKIISLKDLKSNEKNKNIDMRLLLIENCLEFALNERENS